MSSSDPFDIFLVTAPGLESVLRDEAVAAGFAGARVEVGGVTITGGWPEVMRANFALRGPARVLARFASFRALHLAQLDKRARRVDWGAVLARDVPVRVEASSKGSRLYHTGAIAQRIGTAIAEEFGAPLAADAPVRIVARVEDDLVTLSVDTTGEALHRRGHKQAVNAAPMRENLAALFLRQAGYDGAEPVLDPMCGSGTFVIEAAEIAAGLKPGRARSFAFEQLAPFDRAAWEAMRREEAVTPPAQRFFGSDRDAGAIRMSTENAARAGVLDWTAFVQTPIHELAAPESAPGLVIVNPPYGARLGKGANLFPLYNQLGRVLMSRFSGWRVGIVTCEKRLADATGLPFATRFPTVDNGGLRVALSVTGALR